MTQRNQRLLGALLTVAALSPATAAGPVLLRLRLEPGDTYRLRMIVDQTIHESYAGQSVDVGQTTGLGYRFSVTGVEPTGVATVRVLYDSVLWKQRGPKGTIQYDSQRRPILPPPEVRGLASLEGQSFTMRITPEGRVTDLGGIDRVLNRMVEAQGPARGAVRERRVNALRTQFDDRAMRETLEQMLAFYPQRAVNVGDAWGRQVTFARGFPRISDTRWTLLGRQNGIATIRVRSQIQANPRGAPVPMGPVQMKYLLSGSREGTLRIEEATGWLQEGTIRESLKGTVTASGSRLTRSVSWPLTVRSTIRFTGE